MVSSLLGSERARAARRFARSCGYFNQNTDLRAVVLDFVATGAGSGTWASEPSKPDYGRLKVLARRLMKSATFERDPSGLAERLGGLLLGPGKAEHVRYEVRRVLQEFEKGRSKLEPAERTLDTAERTLDACKD